MVPSTARGSTPRSSRLLIAVQREELFERFHNHLTREPLAGWNLRAQHCFPEQLDAQIRDYETEALIVIEPRFREGLAGAVRHWKALRPDLQALFIFRKLPEARD